MTRRRRRKSDEAPGWVWMTFGLGIGLIIALGVYLNGPRIFGTASSADAGRSTAPAIGDPAALPPPTVEMPAAATATPAAESPGERTATAPPAARATDSEPGEDPNRFSFYDLLPSFEVVIPEVETPAPRNVPVTAIETPGVYMLQAGSFLTATDAEAQRARLGLLGIESRVQRVSIEDRTFHRVRIGPIEDLDELDSVRSRLRSADVDSMIMRVDP